MSDETRVSDAEREQAVARLRDASADGRLTLEELASRTDDAYAARTHGELVRVTADLPTSTPEPERRTGLRVVAGLFAPARVDLRRSRAATGDVVAVGLFAPASVVVPAGVEVELSVLGVFAPVREHGAPAELPPDAPRIRIRGLALFAPVVVHHERS